MRPGRPAGRARAATHAAAGAVAVQRRGLLVRRDRGPRLPAHADQRAERSRPRPEEAFM